MYYVYILKSLNAKNKIYIGATSNLKIRLKSHNEGHSTHTKKFKPWEIETYIAFSNKINALKFEKYLKSGSGKAFLKRRLITS